jgi:hypothetical protein
LVHTRGKEERVWTLPTGLLALAAARHGRADYALRMLQNIAGTTRTGMLGAFKELIPQGLCFVQLWSAGLYVQGILEGLLGLEPHAHAHRLNISPTLPSTWPSVTLRDLRVGAHRLNLEIGAATVTAEHVGGPQEILIGFLPAGAIVADQAGTGAVPSDAVVNAAQNMVHMTLRVGETAAVAVQNGVAHVQHRD